MNAVMRNSAERTIICSPLPPPTMVLSLFSNQGYVTLPEMDIMFFFYF